MKSHGLGYGPRLGIAGADTGEALLNKDVSCEHQESIVMAAAHMLQTSPEENTIGGVKSGFSY